MCLAASAHPVSQDAILFPTQRQGSGAQRGNIIVTRAQGALVHLPLELMTRCDHQVRRNCQAGCLPSCATEVVKQAEDIILPPLPPFNQDQEVPECHLSSPHCSCYQQRWQEGQRLGRGQETQRQQHGRRDKRGLVNNPLPSPIPVL